MRYLLIVALMSVIACNRGEVTGLPVDISDPELSMACEAGCSASLAEIATQDVADQPGAQVGQLTTCPVSGVVFRVHEGSPVVAHEGRSYFACCGGCAARLETELAAAGARAQLSP